MDFELGAMKRIENKDLDGGETRSCMRLAMAIKSQP